MYKNNLEIITLNEAGITDFAEARNKKLNTSKSEWIFFLDSDEKMGKKLKNEIMQKIKNKEYNGYTIIRQNYFLGIPVGRDEILRLGKRGAGKWKRKVHEYWQIKGNIGKLKNPIIHNNAKSLREYINKINRYSVLHAKANMDEGKKSGLFKIIFYPIFQFIISLIKKRGVVFSIMQSLHSFLAWSMLYQNQKK